MESRSERMGTVATTADVLEAQQKEQKVSWRSRVDRWPHNNLILICPTVIPRWTASVQASRRAVQPADAEIDRRLPDRRHVAHQTDDRECQSQVKYAALIIDALIPVIEILSHIWRNAHKFYGFIAAF